MSRDGVRQTVNVVMVIVTLVINGMANAVKFNGVTTAEVSDRFQVYFVPAGYVFAIWGIIYLGLVAFAIYQALPSQRTNPRLQRIGYIFAVSCLANAVWIPLWHYGYLAVTVLVMLVLLACLIAIYLRLDIGRTRVRAVERWCVDIPFSIYLGWISVATIANITDYLDSLKWSGFGIAPDVWAVIMLGVALLLTVLMLVLRFDVAYALVIIWAVTGIANKQAATPLVANAAYAVAALVVVALAVIIYMRRTGRFNAAAA
jgi:hypothetical protein